jgi:Asp/Glu/hydantoin racemase
MPVPARIVLIHALRDSQVPTWAAFAKGWPEAEIHNLLDDSLSADLAAEGSLKRDMIERFLTLGRYAAGTAAQGHKTDAILFTCSAFGPAIDAVKKDLAIPVLKPNEAAFEQALACGHRIGLLVTFAPALPAMQSELEAMAKARNIPLQFTGRVAEGALAALQAGRPEEHDRLVAATAAEMPPLDALVLGQFSLARAAPTIAPVKGRAVFTTPEAAVAKLKGLVR